MRDLRSHCVRCETVTPIRLTQSRDSGSLAAGVLGYFEVECTDCGNVRGVTPQTFPEFFEELQSSDTGIQQILTNAKTGDFSKIGDLLEQ